MRDLGVMRVLVRQSDRWDGWHSATEAIDHEPFHDRFRDRFRHAAAQLSDQPRVLELGCGQGRDAIAMAAAGLSVTALDFSAVALDMAARTARAHGVAVSFTRHDIASPLPCRSAGFDGVFSYLSLHYFDHATTVRVFAEITRVLRPGGVLAFCVRSTGDPRCARGELIERDMYSDGGHVRHFFSVDYARSLLGGWQIADLGLAKVHYLVEHGPPGEVVHALAAKAAPAEGGELS